MCSFAEHAQNGPHGHDIIAIAQASSWQGFFLWLLCFHPVVSSGIPAPWTRSGSFTVPSRCVLPSRAPRHEPDTWITHARQMRFPAHKAQVDQQPIPDFQVTAMLTRLPEQLYQSGIHSMPYATASPGVLAPDSPTAAASTDALNV